MTDADSANISRNSGERRGPLFSRRELLVQLVIITLGVMIALSFEGVREWRNDRALVAQARQNLTNEIRDNKIEIDGMGKAYLCDL